MAHKDKKISYGKSLLLLPVQLMYEQCREYDNFSRRNT